MILEFSIENTYSIRDKQTMSFEAVGREDDAHVVTIGNKRILRLACIYGANASGKTKLLQALYDYIIFMLFSFSGVAPNGGTRLTPFKFDEEKADDAGSFDIVFYVDDVRYQYDLTIDKERVITESLYHFPNGRKNRVFERIIDGTIKWGSTIRGNKSALADIIHGRANCSVISCGAQVGNDVLKSVYDYFFNRFGNLILPDFGYVQIPVKEGKHIKDDNGFKQTVLELLAAVDVGNIADITVKEKPVPKDVIQMLPKEMQDEATKTKDGLMAMDIDIVHKYDKNYSLKVEEESDGTVKMMSLAEPLVKVAQGKSFLVIDEIESSLHQDLQELLIRFLLASDNDSQLLFTTHNQLLLDSGLLRDDEVWFCGKGENGGSEFSSLTDYKNTPKKASRRELYASGRFGGLPIVDMQKIMEAFIAKKD